MTQQSFSTVMSYFSLFSDTASQKLLEEAALQCFPSKDLCTERCLLR